MGVLFCFVVGLFMALQPISDNDFFWHMVVGNRVLLDKIIPNHELYSWASGKSWVAHEWLTEAIMYKLGPVGCITIMLVILTAFLTFILTTIYITNKYDFSDGDQTISSLFGGSSSSDDKLTKSLKNIKSLLKKYYFSILIIAMLIIQKMKMI